jgi:carbonic anhydrase
METAYYLGFIILLVAAAVIIAIMVWLKEKAWQKKIQETAKRNGLLFYADDEKSAEQYNYLNGFSIAHSYGILNIKPDMELKNILVMQNSAQKLRMFEYTRITGSGKNRSKSKYTCMRGTLDKDIPDFVLRKETIFDKASAFFGYNDIDFERHEEFSRIYYLQSNSPNIRVFFDNDILSFFEREKTDFSIESKGKELLLYKKGRLSNPEDYISALREGEKIIQKFAGKNEQVQK